MESIIRNLIANLRRDVARRHAINVLKNTGYRLVNPMTA
nr:MAG TPA: KDP operon transcriptional regulatory protein [Caudoviricetes sp.]